MGELRKKIGMGFLHKLNFILIIALSLGLAVVVQYRLLEKTVKTDVDTYVQYFAYFLFIFAFIIFIIFYIKVRAVLPMNVYQNGIVLKRRRETIMYQDIPTFYFIPYSDRRIKYLIVEKGNGGRVIFNTNHTGDDFVDYFQKDYMAINTDKFLEKIRNGSDMMFGVLSKKQTLVLKVFKTKNMVRKLEFEDKFYISKDTFQYKDVKYNWNIIDIDYDIQTGNIEIKDRDNNIIMSTYFPYVEKGEFAFNIMDNLIEESIKNQDKVEIEYIENNNEHIAITDNELDDSKYIDENVFIDDKEEND